MSKSEMNDWKNTDLGELVEIEHGYAFKGEYFADSGDLVLLTPGNFHETGGFKLRPGKDRSYTADYPHRYLLEENDIIVAMTEQAEGLLGCTARIPASNTYLLNQRLGRLHPKVGKANARFLYYLFNTNLVRQQVRNSSSGAKVRHTSPKRIYATKVNVPGESTQRKIAGVLSAYDDLIENNRRRIAILESMAEEIYREWFVRMRFPGHQNAKSGKGVPEGWNYELISKAFRFTGGGTPSKMEPEYWTAGEVNWYTPSDITCADGLFLSQSTEKCNEEGLARSSATIFPEYSIMLTSRATIGAIGINTTPACTNQGFITCIPNEKYPLTYLYHWIKLAKPQFEILSSGATFKELTKGTFKKMLILTPPVEIVGQFNLQVSPLFKLMERLQAANRLLVQARDALLVRLIAGKLSVEDLDIQLPTSMSVLAAEATNEKPDHA